MCVTQSMCTLSVHTDTFTAKADFVLGSLWLPCVEMYNMTVTYVPRVALLVET